MGGKGQDTSKAYSQFYAECTNEHALNNNSTYPDWCHKQTHAHADRNGVAGAFIRPSAQRTGELRTRMAGYLAANARLDYPAFQELRSPGTHAVQPQLAEVS